MSTYDDFFYNLPPDEQETVSRLRSIVLSCADFSEKISYQVPYYFRHSRILFIWPSSVKPGPPSGVQFGFCNGNLLSDEYGILEKGTRKQVYWITFHKAGEINEQPLRELIHQAILVDEELYAKRKKR